MSTNVQQELNHQYEFGIVRLAILMARDHAIEDEDQLLEYLSVIEVQLLPKDIAFFHALSSDLYMIEDAEIYTNTITELDQPSSLSTAMRHEYIARNWQSLLTLLRKQAHFPPQEIRAYLRGHSYEELGFHAAAWAFYKNASERNENGERMVYEYLGLLNLSKWDLDAAYQEANLIMNNPDADSALKLLAAYVIMKYLRDDIDQRHQEIKGLALRLLPAIGVAVRDSTLPSEVIGAGYAVLALILEKLGDYQNSADVHRIVGRYIPPNAKIFEIISHLDQVAASGQGTESGVLLNLELQILNPPDVQREANFHGALNRKVELSLAVE